MRQHGFGRTVCDRAVGLQICINFWKKEQFDYLDEADRVLVLSIGVVT